MTTPRLTAARLAKLRVDAWTAYPAIPWDRAQEMLLEVFAELDALARERGEARVALAEMQWIATTLRSGLENWGRHHDWCGATNAGTAAQTVCNCGFAAATAPILTTAHTPPTPEEK